MTEHLHQLSSHVMIIASDTRKLQSYKHLIPNATVVGYSDLSPGDDSMGKLGSIIENSEINI